ncbi:MAG: hypothetical protein RLZZ148_2937 [Cyanobacteriota bacterium]
MTKSFDIWNYKPWWCQPWSILLTGIVIIGSSWLIGKNIWISLLVSLPIVAWWVYFLILYPRLVSQAMEESQGEN